MLGLSRLSYWVLPVIGGVFWLATLMALLLYWVFSTNRMHYPSMGEAQTLAYISDVGAYNLKPLFITGSVLTTIFFDLAFAADRWLRHRGRLVPNHITMEKVLSGLTIFFAVVGTVGLILLSIFDTASHPMLHNLFLGFFIGGYMLSAVFICWEYQRLGVQHREHSILATSFWVKLAFIIVEVALAIVFGVTTRSRNFNVAAAVEWTIAFIFVFYVWSFVIDLYPAVRTRRGPGFGGHSKGMAVPVEAEQEMGEGSSGSQTSGMPAAHNHHQQYRSAQQNF